MATLLDPGRQALQDQPFSRLPGPSLPGPSLPGPSARGITLTSCCMSFPAT